MAFFRIKEWFDRISENPTRRRITDTTSGVSQTVDVTREEGDVTQEGTPLGAMTFNDLESRISEAFDSVEEEIKKAGGDVSFEDEEETDIPEYELPFYPSGEYPELNSLDKHIIAAINEALEGGSGSSYAVLYVGQQLTEEQQLQAQRNIGILSSEGVEF